MSKLCLETHRNLTELREKAFCCEALVLSTAPPCHTNHFKPVIVDVCVLVSLHLTKRGSLLVRGN